MIQASRRSHRAGIARADPVDHGFAARTAALTATGPTWRIGAHAVGQIVVLNVTGPLDDVVEGLDQVIRCAVADRPRGVVCDLPGVLEGATPRAVGMLATAGRHVRDWSGTPVTLACPDSRVRRELNAHPLGRYLHVTASMPLALSAVLQTRPPTDETVRLAPHPTAPRAARNFVSRTLVGWRMSAHTPAASLVVSELVTNAMVHTGTDVDVTLEEHQGTLRVTVLDRGAGLPLRRGPHLGVGGRGLVIVAGVSRDWGVLPTVGGGKVVWAVLDARTQPHRSTPYRSDPCTHLG